MRAAHRLHALASIPTVRGVTGFLLHLPAVLLLARPIWIYI